MKIKACKFVVVTCIVLFCSSASALTRLIVLPIPLGASGTFNSMLLGPINLPKASYASTAPELGPDAITTSPLGIAYEWQPLAFNSLPPESTNSLMLTQHGKPAFTFAVPKPSSYTIEFTGVAGDARYPLSTKHVSPPLPQPERYAMMLAGLGVMATIVRRRYKFIAT